MKFAVAALGLPVLANVLHHGFLVFFTLILGVGNIILDALYLLTERIFSACHRQIQILIKHLALLQVCQSLAHRSGLSFFQRDRFPQVTVLEGQHLVWVKAQHVVIPDAVCNAVPMQFVAENGGGGAHFLLVFALDRRTGKTKEQCFR